MRRLLLVIACALIGCGGSGRAKTSLASSPDAAATGPTAIGAPGGGFVGSDEDARAGELDAAELAADVSPAAPPDAPRAASPDAPPPAPDLSPDAPPPLPNYVSAWPGPDPGPAPIPDPTARDRCREFIAWFCQLEANCAHRNPDTAGLCASRRLIALQDCKLIAATSERLPFCFNHAAALDTGQLCARYYVDGMVVLPEECQHVLIVGP